MPRNTFAIARNKTSVALLVLALVIGGISAQATGLLNLTSGGYLVCVNPKTTVVTHPATSKCPKGYEKLILGAQGNAGTVGITGAAGISGVDGKNGSDGKNGLDGKTLWNGTTDPVSTWGAAGDMFINSATKVLFGPKDLTTGWPAGVPMLGLQGVKGDTGERGQTGPQGSTGATGSTGGTGSNGAAGAAGSNGTNGTNGGAAPTATGSNCISPATTCTYKIGDTGPGGGSIFFVDYNDQYAGFNYLEAAPSSCQATKAWSSDTTHSLVAVNGWAARAVGSGQANTTAMLADGATSYLRDTSGAASYASSCRAGSKSDWFLGSLGEMKLMYDNLQGVGGFVADYYWSSSERNAGNAWSQVFGDGNQLDTSKNGTPYVRPVRAF